MKTINKKLILGTVLSLAGSLAFGQSDGSDDDFINGNGVYGTTGDIITESGWSGDVGIGVSDPQSKLDVDGDISIKNGGLIKMRTGATTFYNIFDANGQSLKSGKSAGLYNSGNYNTFVGYLAGRGATQTLSNKGVANTFVGRFSGLYHNGGDQNVSLGVNAAFNGAGSYNVLLGNSSGYSSNGTKSVNVGWSSGYGGSGTESVTLGYESGKNNSGTDNVSAGAYSNYTGSGSKNVNIGKSSNYVGGGNQNVYLGYYAQQSGPDGNEDCIALGANAQVGSLADLVNATAIGANSSVTQDNSMVLGAIGGTGTYVGIGMTDPDGRFHVDATGDIIKLEGLTGVTGTYDVVVIKDDVLYTESVANLGGGGSSSSDDDWYGWNMGPQTNTGTAPTNINDDMYTNGTVIVGDAVNQNGRVWVTGSDDTPILTATNTNNGNVSMGVSAETQGSNMSIAGSFYAHDGNTNIGIMAQASYGGTNWAGYFGGDVFTTSSFIGSDRKLKTNISKYSGAIENLMKVGIKTYNFKEEYHFMGFSDRDQIGVIAQELQEVYPAMVKEAIRPAEYDLEGNVTREAVDFLSVNYDALIPVLIRGIQEQQAEIEILKQEVMDLQEASTSTNKNTGISFGDDIEMGLAQNRPNPFSERTVISYTMSDDAQSGQILVFNMSGVLIKTVNLSTSGKGEVVIEASELTPGMYLYSLMIDNQEIDTKRMILTE